MSARLMHMVAEDLGVMRIDGEDSVQFMARAAYTALRFWMQAYCLDDGYGGSYGVSEKTVRHKTVDWLDSIGAIYPAVANWFAGHDGYADAAKHVFDVLTVTGDLVQTREGMYRCAAQHTLPVGMGRDIIMGLSDPTQHRTTAMSGMAYLALPMGQTFPSWPGYRQDVQREHSAVLKPIDGRHTLITLDAPLDRSFHRDRIIELLIWPHRTANDQTEFIARTDYANLIVSLLEHAGFTTESHQNNQ